MVNVAHGVRLIYLYKPLINIFLSETFGFEFLMHHQFIGLQGSRSLVEVSQAMVPGFLIILLLKNLLVST